MQSSASVARAEYHDVNGRQNQESCAEIERLRIRTHQRQHRLLGQRAIDGTSAVITELYNHCYDVQASDRNSPQKRLASRITDVTTWLKETAAEKSRASVPTLR